MVIAADGAGIPAIVRVPSCAAADGGGASTRARPGSCFRAATAAAIHAAIEPRSSRRTASAGSAVSGPTATARSPRPLRQGGQRADAMIAQIETAGARRARRDRGRAGLDVLYVGPNDLTQALGVPGQYGTRGTGERSNDRAPGEASGKSRGHHARPRRPDPALGELGLQLLHDRATGRSCSSPRAPGEAAVSA
jgi:2-keto-3-deoxy-L-rhamnonate aldolase RhmA